MDGEKWLVLGFLAREKWDALSKECGRVWLTSSNMSPFSYKLDGFDRKRKILPKKYRALELAFTGYTPSHLPQLQNYCEVKEIGS